MESQRAVLQDVYCSLFIQKRQQHMSLITLPASVGMSTIKPDSPSASPCRSHTNTHTQRHRLTLTQTRTGSCFSLCSPQWPPPPPNPRPPRLSRYPGFNVFIRKQRLCEGRETMNLYSTSWSGLQHFCCRTTLKYTAASPSSPSSSI